MLPYLRKCKDLGEFFERLQKERMSKSSEFLVWRSLENARTVAKASVTGLALAGKRTRIDVRLNRQLELGEGDTLYFYQEESGALFKTSVEKGSGYYVETRLAAWPFLLEKRKEARFEFFDTHYFLEISSYHENMDKTLSHQVELKNISVEGFAFSIGAGRAQRFQKGDKITLRKIEQTALPVPALGKVAHITPIREAKRESGSEGSAEFSRKVLIGVCFDEANNVILRTLDALKQFA